MTEIIRRWSHRPEIDDLKRPYANRVLTDRRATGSMEVAFLRGFQGGYEQALRDAKNGQLKKHHALEPDRARKDKR